MVALAGGTMAQQQTAPGAAVLDSEEEDTRRYAVEMIVFEYAGNAAGTTESFAPDLPVEPLQDGFMSDRGSTDGVPEYGDPVADPQSPGGTGSGPSSVEDLPVAIVDEEEAGQPFVLMPGEMLGLIETYEQSGIRSADPADYELTAAFARLDRLDAYRPLLHTRWTQPALEQDLSTALDLRRIGNPPLRLDGTVTLYLGRFLHLDLDIALEETVAIDPQMAREAGYYGDTERQPDAMRYGGLPTKAPVHYRIREDRIMRNDEVRYFDHPKFGVIAKVTRVEEEAPARLDTTEDLLPGVNQ
jgi:hypothetical protein